MTDDMRYDMESFKESLEKVDITTDVMFSTVMQDEALCIELLEYLLPLEPGKRITHLKYKQFSEDAQAAGITTEIQKSFFSYYGQHSVRLDVFVDDGETVYDIEMQSTNRTALPQRARFVQAHMDISQLRTGEFYDKLRPSYVIFICKFDLFGDDLYRYTFRNMCQEVADKPLDEGTIKLFFNTAGHIGDISPRLKELLTYMNDTWAYPVDESKDDLIRKLDTAVREYKMDPAWRDAFMAYQLKMMDVAIKNREEGIQIGIVKGREEGEQIGEERGLKRGRAEGLAEGRAAEKRENARNLPADGVSEGVIANSLKLPLSEVLALKAQMAQ